MKGSIENDLTPFLPKSLLSNLFSAGQDLEKIIKIIFFKQCTKNWSQTIKTINYHFITETFIEIAEGVAPLKKRFI